jgi:crotonobetainyl-CoA:carnitine CoA-transferase CaiB-like acyl-CoA transferase
MLGPYRVLDLTGDRGEIAEMVLGDLGADIVLESAPGSDLAEHRIGFEQLRAAHPRLVHVQISPFGTDGPAASWPASDLTISALGGPVAVQGVVPDRAPVRLSVPQVWRHAGAEAACPKKWRSTPCGTEGSFAKDSALPWAVTAPPAKPGASR